jgi:hypothetical protein
MPDETDHARVSRNITDLFGGLRVAQAGVQILFGFLLSVAFTPVFHTLPTTDRILHMSAVILTALSTVFLTAPAAWHRMLFGTGRREFIVTWGNRFVIVGLVCLSVAIIVSVLLVGRVVFGSTAANTIAQALLIIFGLVWFGVPIWIRLRR